MRVSALTAALGLTAVADTYNLSNTTPNILYELVLGGVLSATLVPLFIAGKSDPDGEDTTSIIVTVSFCAITGLTILAILLSPLINWFFALPLSGAEKEQQMQIGGLFLALLLPQILFYGITTLATALLHSRRRYAAPAFAPVLTNVVTSGAALAVWLFISSGAASDTSTLTVYLLGLGTTAGVAAMAAALVRPVRNAGIKLNWDFQPRHAAVKQLVRLSGWTVGFAASNQVALLVVLTLARGSGAGAVSAYQYAFIFFQLPFGLIAVSIMTTVLPELADAAANRDVQRYRERFREGLGLLLVFLLPAAGALMFLGRPLIQVLLERGNFDETDTIQTTRMLAGFAVGLPAFSVFLYCMRAFYSLRNTRLPFYLNLFENGLNVVLVIPFIALWDSIGLSLAYSVAYWVAVGVAIVVLNRKVPDLLGVASARIFIRSLVVAIVITLVGYATDLVFQERVGPVMQLVIPAAVVAPIFVVLVTMVKPLGFEELNAAIRRRVSSGTG